MSFQPFLLKHVYEHSYFFSFIITFHVSFTVIMCVCVYVVGRQELLTFLAGYAEDLHAPVDCTELPVPLVLAMQDKTAVVRSLAENLLAVLNARALITKVALDKATRDLAPAAKRTLMPSVERMMQTWGTRRAGGVPVEEEAPEPSIQPGTYSVLT